MAKEELEIIVAPDGTVQVTTHGIKGPKCLEATRFLEETLGRVTHRELTPEYYEPDVHITEKGKVRDG